MVLTSSILTTVSTPLFPPCAPFIAKLLRIVVYVHALHSKTILFLTNLLLFLSFAVESLNILHVGILNLLGKLECDIL